ncbi:MAG: SOS response-associated peptidase [Acidimicrobiia bacterium]|nr:SOS response-associated peptidase [Acidimicrobiia bacterium]MCY4433836.1 SOS response-associated peptidase [bacterium]
MCGRYSLTASPAELAQRFEFEFDSDTEAVSQRYNIAPTQQVLTVVGGEPRQARFMRWGLIPRWAKEASTGRPLINARAETVAEKPSFRDSLKRRRCLVLADGFYEWQKRGDTKRPMRIVMRSGEPFAFAGLWAEWKDPAGSTIESCAIITTEANDLLRPIHHRMPVILTDELEGPWLDTALDDSTTLTQFLAPYSEDAMEAYEVSRLVNSASNNVPEVTEPVGLGI